MNLQGLTPLESKVLHVISEQSGVVISSIHRNSRLIDDLAMDSLDSVELMLALEGEFRIEIADAELVAVKTVGDVIRLVARLSGVHLDEVDNILPILDPQALRRETVRAVLALLCPQEITYDRAGDLGSISMVLHTGKGDPDRFRGDEIVKPSDAIGLIRYCPLNEAAVDMVLARIDAKSVQK